MAKILLVEDDNNLREIYEARLQAEGYQIVSANDGEAALVVAKAEKPDLIISDVMMPKISGFEMLDILRNTDELKATKVIMLTALGQADDQSRADKLGADRYLVKSQVTLEDIVRVSHELLGDQPAAEAQPTPTPAAPAAVEQPPAAAQAVTPTPEQPAPTIAIAAPPAAPAAAVAQPPASAPAPAEPSSTPSSGPVTASTAQSSADEEAAVTKQIEDFVAASAAVPPVAPVPATTTTPASPTTTDDATATAQANTMSDDKMLADAVNDLVTSTDAATTPSADTPATPTPVAAEAAPQIVPEPTPVPITPETETPPSNNDTVPIAHKKVIQPIPGEPKPDLDALLAAEEAKEPPSTKIVVSDVTSVAPPAEPSTEDAPSGAPAPTPGTSVQPGSNGVDPNSIAL